MEWNMNNSGNVWMINCHALKQRKVCRVYMRLSTSTPLNSTSVVRVNVTFFQIHVISKKIKIFGLCTNFPTHKGGYLKNILSNSRKTTNGHLRINSLIYMHLISFQVYEEWKISLLP